MNRIRLVPMIAAAALMLVALGCQSTGTQRTASATTSMARLDDMLEDGTAQIDPPIASLNPVRRSYVTDEIDPLGAFKDYQSELNRLESTAASIRKQAQQMRTSAQAHYDAWEAELEALSNEQLRERGSARRQQVLEAFERINKASQEARDLFDPMMSDLRDIEVVLSNDLSAAGVESLHDLMDEANGDSRKVNQAIDDVMAEIRNVRSMMGAS
jgi:hypothetical protein